MNTKLILDSPINPSEIIQHSEYASKPNAAAGLANLITISEHYWVGVIDDDVACIFGIISPSLLSNSAYLWMVVTEIAEQHPFIFVRKSRIILDQLFGNYARIIGSVDPTKSRNVKWLKWLGAEFFEPVMTSYGGMIPFEIRRR